MNEQIVVSLIDGRAVVQEAPEHSWIGVELLAEFALGRGRDAYVTDDDILGMGVVGMGLGHILYEVGDYDPERHAYPLTRMSGRRPVQERHHDHG